MKSISEYLNYLHALLSKTTDVKIKTSIQKLIILLNELNQRKIFDGDAHLIIERLQTLENKIQENPEKMFQYVLSCHNAIINICSKFFNLVEKGKYQLEWNGLGLSLGLMLGVVVYALTNDDAYIALGLPIGLAIGWGVGSSLDRKAKNENRILEGI